METQLHQVTSLQQTSLCSHWFGPGAPSHELWKRNILLVTPPVKVVKEEKRFDLYKVSQLIDFGLCIIFIAVFSVLFFFLHNLMVHWASLIFVGFSTSGDVLIVCTEPKVGEKTWKEVVNLSGSLDLLLLCDLNSCCTLSFSLTSWLMFTPVCETLMNDGIQAHTVLPPSIHSELKLSHRTWWILWQIVLWRNSSVLVKVILTLS